MRNRKTYLDLDLVFAAEPPSATLGAPLEMSGLSNTGEFPRLVKVAKVRKIKFHGLRHTCATLALEAGVPPKVVQERLGHTKISMTLDTYAHAVEGMQQQAADRIGAVLHR
jgi:integrase